MIKIGIVNFASFCSDNHTYYVLAPSFLELLHPQMLVRMFVCASTPEAIDN